MPIVFKGDCKKEEKPKPHRPKDWVVGETYQSPEGDIWLCAKDEEKPTWRGAKRGVKLVKSYGYYTPGMSCPVDEIRHDDFKPVKVNLCIEKEG